jgi:hypothetical protein
MSVACLAILGVVPIVAAGCSDPTSRAGSVAADREGGVHESFVETTEAVGLDFVHHVGQLEAFNVLQIMGSGAAFWDFDLDGRLDIFLVDGVAENDLRGPRGFRDRLFRQAPDGRFVEVTGYSGVVGAGFGQGAAVGDIDNDGFPDLFVTNFGIDQFWLNNGDGTFLELGQASGIAGTRWGTAAAFFDYDRDGCLDLFVASYADLFADEVCQNGTGQRDYCGPGRFASTAHKLFHNRGISPTAAQPLFADVTVATGIAAQTGKGMGLITRDFTGDLRPDVFVANDMEANHLWVQSADGTFQDESLLRGVAFNEFGGRQANMGVICGDLTGDGEFDLYVTHLFSETNTLFAGDSDGRFIDVTAKSGVGKASLPYTGFGVAAVDLEHDGDLDLIVANGRIHRGPVSQGAGPGSHWDAYAEPRQILLNDGRGHFTEENAGGGRLTGVQAVSRGLAAGDIDNDGDLDVLVTECGGPARLFINEFPKQGSWLEVRVIGTRQNRDGIGAQVSVRVGERIFRREVAPSAGYLTSNDARVHFGLGRTDRYDALEIRWLDGTCDRFPGGSVNRQLVLREGDARLSVGGAQQ